jgi:hypothetical protein
MNVISVLLFFFAGVCNACMDVLRTRYNTSVFRFWRNQNWVNPALSWPNKWKPDSKFGDLIMSTVLVWVTDFWHMCKMLMILCFTLGAIFYQPIFGDFSKIWLDLLILYFIFTGTFELFFSKVLIKK